MKKTNLLPEELLNKKFSTELSGYNPEEVDKYLDMILEDYHSFIEEVKKSSLIINEKMALIADRDQDIDKLKIEIANLKDQLAEANKNTNYELVKKIEKLTEITEKNNNKK